MFSHLGAQTYWRKLRDENHHDEASSSTRVKVDERERDDGPGFEGQVCRSGVTAGRLSQIPPGHSGNQGRTRALKSSHLRGG